MKKLLGLTLSELKAICEGYNLPKFTAKQITEWIYKHHICDIQEMTNLSKKTREILSNQFCIGTTSPIHSVKSVDGTIKYLFSTNDGKFVETVYIPDKDRATLCVSCQVGCKMGCKFCMTGKQGWSSSLDTNDILNQIYSIPDYDKLTNIVFMGQGEPMDNFDNILKVTEILTSEWGYSWSPKRITISTVGLSNINRLIEETKCNIAISLHHPDPKERKNIMPMEKAFSIINVIDALKKHSSFNTNFSTTLLGDKQRRLTFEYILFKNLNDQEVHAKQLLKLLEGVNCRLNLIKFHTIPDSEFQGVELDNMIKFRDYMTAHGIFTTIRASRGEDIFAACGLLTTKHKI